ncbi:hypothetical protein [Paracerasibacillus soli]|uniref:Uncharacterized protein n=1 Tax=Paracerasibacillus soli TaxID=480284 RepID=A0ABU5CR01_9BACI|nr:hypothetical protein [Virgibacillus soli]MDY0407890.1 hypothetical protein [Virgibacillus soli]
MDEEGKPCKAYPDDPWDATMGNYTLRVATKTRVPVTFNNFSLPNPDEVIFRQYRYKDKVGKMSNTFKMASTFLILFHLKKQEFIIMSFILSGMMRRLKVKRIMP